MSQPSSATDSSSVAATTTYVYIVAKAQDQNGNSLAITAGTDGGVYVHKLSYGSDTQLWEKRTVASRTDGSGHNLPIYGLINKSLNKCIVRDANHQGANLSLISADNVYMNTLAMWRYESFGGWNSFADWEQKINIPGNGPYHDGQRLVTWGYSGGAPNETWYPVNEFTNMEVIDLSFNMNQLNLTTQSPQTYHYQTIINDTDIEQKDISITYSTEIADSYSFTNSSKTTLTQTVGAKFQVPIIDVGAKVSLTTEETFTFSTTKSQSKSTKTAIQYSANVKPRTKLTITGLLLSGTLNIPYTARVRVHFPDTTTQERNITGTFTRVSGYTTQETVTTSKITK